jgi:8-oxo-dGTP pyrophosphatase MutT (NUDIX family)
VACTIPVTDAGDVVLLRRGFEPGRRAVDLSGRLRRPGESVEQAAERETMEELELDVELGAWSASTPRRTTASC